MYRFLINDVQVEEPIGFDGFEYLLQRSDEYTGLENVYSIGNLEFDGLGAELIKEEFETNGFDGSLNLTIQTLCDGSVIDQINGVINLVTYKEINNAVSVHIEESGFHRKFINRIEIPVNFNDPLSIGGATIGAATLFDLGLHSKQINKTSLLHFSDADEAPFPSSVAAGWALAGSDIETATIVSITSSGNRTFQGSFSQDILPGVEVYNEIEERSTDTMTLVRSGTYPADDTQSQGTSIFTIQNDLTEVYSVEGRIKFALYSSFDVIRLTEDDETLTYAQSFTVKLYLKMGDSAPFLIDSKPPIVYNTTFYVDGILNTYTGFPFTEFEFVIPKKTASLINGDNIKLYIKIDSERVVERFTYRPAIPPPQYKLDVTVFSYFKKEYSTEIDSYISTIEQSKTDPSTAKSLLIFDAFKQVCESITDTTDCFKSDFFSVGCGRWTAVTNGKNIRQMRQKDGTTYFPIVTNFKDLFNSANAIWNLGMRIETIEGKQYVRVEEKSYFYNGDAIMSLSNVADIEKNVAVDLIYNEAEFGYDKWNLNIGKTNGIDEFNSLHRYTLPVVNIKKKYTQKSKAITSGYAIEETRRKNYKENPTSDFETDDDIFFICTNTTTVTSDLYTTPPTNTTYPAGTVSERDENFQGIENVISPKTCYNLRLSPLRMALNHYPLLAASMDKKVDPVVRFMSAEGNFEEIDELNDACDKAIGAIIQNQNIEVNNLITPAAYYRPYYLIFDYPLTLGEFLNIRDNAIKAIDISNDCGQILGYIKEIKFEPNGENGGIASFKLLEALCRIGAFDSGFDFGFDIGTC